MRNELSIVHTFIQYSVIHLKITLVLDFEITSEKVPLEIFPCIGEIDFFRSKNRFRDFLLYSCSFALKD